MSEHRARKRFGQHFLHDPFVIERLLMAIAPQPQDRLVEIGPGLGALTCPLLERAGRLHVVELDRDVIPLLEQKCGGKGELEVTEIDALRFDFSRLVENDKPLRLVGNLPYNISTPLIFHVLESAARISDMHFMLQKEVVDRICAAPGSKDYGRLSVMVQYFCATESLFDVGPGAFKPPPKVDSAIVRLIPHAAPPVAVDDLRIFKSLVASAFNQRRKTLRKILKGQLDTAAIEALGLDSNIRPEQLGLQEFATLANRLVDQAAR
ncbi:MAG: 16S rRNA (adenine(1518)-N(6)/adenine(1519)-N(6))-dimethyltransferase RsmA [Gammaproteobacteria bacterium]|nr:16S rRNA (adenine(1518)-N(6)/adenine(1519)-N(6))-dimethyltransferase RsmA [Gammaproteobacteria bacterium]MCP5137768.1 16S rRNA (adenine(1518)-N(6)/adenine(1519)-N(6))-dimethyltransferase RsmA [Gammaproteobacteria bacterium]